MSISVMIIVFIQISEKLAFGFFKTSSVRHADGEVGLFFRIGIFT